MTTTRRFVVIGRTAIASSRFSLDDLPSTSGRLDVLLRCLRAGLLISHGKREDTVVYLVLLGGELAPRTLRFDGRDVRFLRPDERHLATTVRKVLSMETTSVDFQSVKPGISIARGGVDAVLRDIGGARCFLLERGAADVRSVGEALTDAAFFLGDHLGFDEPTRRLLEMHGISPIGLGPVCIHTEDAITLLHNEIDRDAQPAAPRA
jgi:tRNA (pseudouridine54-N1)-methyltransferase